MTQPESRLFGHERRRTLPTRPRPPVWKWALPALALAGAGWWAADWVKRPHDLPVQAQATQRTVAQDWRTLRAFGPRDPGSAGHRRAVDWLATQLEALGYTVTRQPVPLTAVVDRGSSLQVGGRTFPTRALDGIAGGEFTGRLVRVPPEASVDELLELGLQGAVALTTCGSGSWQAQVERLMGAGAQGAVLIDTCPSRPRRPVDALLQPVVLVPQSSQGALLALAGQKAHLSARTTARPVSGENLIARRVSAEPEVVVMAHHDTLPGSPGAESNGSGVLAVLEAARREVGTPMQERTWFLLLDGGEARMRGSDLLTREYVYPLRQTRAALNLDGVGRAGVPLEAATDSTEVTAAPLDPLLVQARPELRFFTEERDPAQPRFGRSRPLIGNSDHLPFKYQHVRTVLLQRGTNPRGGQPDDTQLDPAQVEDAAAFVVKAGQVLLGAPFTPREPCSLNGRGC